MTHENGVTSDLHVSLTSLLFRVDSTLRAWVLEACGCYGYCIKGIVVLSDEFKRFWAVFEISAALLLYFFTLWIIAPHAGAPWANAAFVEIMVFATVYVLGVSPFIYRDSRADRGLGGWRSLFIRCDNLWRAFVQFGFITLAGTALLVMLALWLNTAALSKINWLAVLNKFLCYSPYALVQDLFFYGFIFQRMLTLIPRPAQSEVLSCRFCDAQEIVRHRLTMVALMGIVFSACHIPNSSMMLISFVGAVVWTSVFYMTPNMLVLVLCHAFLGTVVSRIAFLYTRIGPFYAHNDRYVFITVFAGIREWFTTLVKLTAQ